MHLSPSSMIYYQPAIISSICDRNNQIAFRIAVRRTRRAEY
jgi:hypothetical protein